MNSLVVLLSVVALASAKPSGLFDAGLLGYSAPIIAAIPSAVSSQSRLDIKSSPAVVETAAYAPLATRTVIAEPTLLAAPAAVSTQSRLDIKSSPAVVATAAYAPLATRTVIAEPTLLAAPAAIAAPAAVSHQSRIDIKSSPAIESTVISSAPLAYSSYGAPIAYNGYSAPIATAAIAPTLLKTAAFAPAIAAPGFIKTAAFVPGVVGAPAVPLDTPEVVAARAAHFEAKAKALTDVHLIHKRSAPLIATAPVLSTPVVSTYASSPVISSYGAYPLTYAAPYSVGTPIVTKSYGLW